MRVWTLGGWVLGLGGLVGCAPEGAAPALDVSSPQAVYAALLGGTQVPPGIQGYARNGQGYHAYLRFEWPQARREAVLHGAWQTAACAELGERLSLPVEGQDRFQPAWAPQLEMDTLCFEREHTDAFGRADQVLVFEARGQVYFHGVAR